MEIPSVPRGQDELSVAIGRMLDTLDAERTARKAAEARAERLAGAARDVVDGLHGILMMDGLGRDSIETEADSVRAALHEYATNLTTALADAAPAPAPTRHKLSWVPCSSGGLWQCSVCDASYCCPPWTRWRIENEESCPGAKAPAPTPTDAAEAPCGMCGGSGMVPTPCPDPPRFIGGVRVSCVVYHAAPCPTCNGGSNAD